MPVRFISKGKGRNRKAFPIRPKRGVSVRSVSLRPSSVAKINKEQIKLLRRNEPATFSKALNQVVMRAKKLSIPIYDTNVNEDGIRKPYHMWISDMKKHKKVKGSDTLVLAEHYGQAVDDFITIWNKEHRMDKDIGYPVVEGTGLNPIKNQDFFLTEDSTMRKKRTDKQIIKEMFEAQQSKGDRLVDQIRHGDKVTIVTPNGQQVTGSAVMKSGAGDNSWVLNTGGEHGSGAIAFDDNVVKVVEGR